MRRLPLTVLAVALLPLSAPCARGQAFWLDEGAPKPLPKVNLTWGVKIPMRDGALLHATVYRPEKQSAPAPAIVTVSPYQADSYHKKGVFFAGHGYVFVLVDARGRGNSGGAWEPFANEGRDGHDVVEWAAKQDWCDGKVGMWGGSYAGFTQWSTLKQAPPHLKTILPVASAHPGVDFPAPQGIFHLYFFRWLTLTSGRLNNAQLFQDEEFWIAKFRRRYLEHRPLRELDQVVGNPSPHFQKWLDHRRPDGYWDAMVPGPEDYARCEIPVLTVTGHYDSDQLGAMEYYRRHMKYGSGTGKLQHYLVMGPWDHAGTREPKEEIGGLPFGKLSLLPMDQLEAAWYDFALKDGPRPASLMKQVSYYVAGRERWNQVDCLEDIPAEPRRLYLHSDGRADDAFHSGTLRADGPEKSPPDGYRYDPRDTRPAELEREHVKNFLTDQREALNLFGNGVVFHSEPLADPTEVTGYCKFTAWVKLDVPDADFQVDVYEIRPDGTSVLLSLDRLRARYRDGFRREKLVPVGAVVRYDFTNFFFVSRVLQRGSRVRLVFRCLNSIHFEKNYQGGGRVEEETRDDARTATVTLYHDPDRPSHLELPVVLAAE